MPAAGVAVGPGKTIEPTVLGEKVFVRGQEVCVHYLQVFYVSKVDPGGARVIASAACKSAGDLSEPEGAAAAAAGSDFASANPGPEETDEDPLAAWRLVFYQSREGYYPIDGKSTTLLSCLQSALLPNGCRDDRPASRLIGDVQSLVDKTAFVGHLKAMPPRAFKEIPVVSVAQEDQAVSQTTSDNGKAGAAAIEIASPKTGFDGPRNVLFVLLPAPNPKEENICADLSQVVGYVPLRRVFQPLVQAIQGFSVDPSIDGLCNRLNSVPSIPVDFRTSRSGLLCFQGNSRLSTFLGQTLATQINHIVSSTTTDTSVFDPMPALVALRERVLNCANGALAFQDILYPNGLITGRTQRARWAAQVKQNEQIERIYEGGPFWKLQKMSIEQARQQEGCIIGVIKDSPGTLLVPCGHMRQDINDTLLEMPPEATIDVWHRYNIDCRRSTFAQTGSPPFLWSLVRDFTVIVYPISQQRVRMGHSVIEASTLLEILQQEPRLNALPTWADVVEQVKLANPGVDPDAAISLACQNRFMMSQARAAMPFLPGHLRSLMCMPTYCWTPVPSFYWSTAPGTFPRCSWNWYPQLNLLSLPYLAHLLVGFAETPHVLADILSQGIPTSSADGLI